MSQPTNRPGHPTHHMCSCVPVNLADSGTSTTKPPAARRHLDRLDPRLLLSPSASAPAGDAVAASQYAVATKPYFLACRRAAAKPGWAASKSFRGPSKRLTRPSATFSVRARASLSSGHTGIDNSPSGSKPQVSRGLLRPCGRVAAAAVAAAAAAAGGGGGGAGVR